MHCFVNAPASGLMTNIDRELGNAVVAELEWDMKVDERALIVEVEGHAVILLGTVGSWAERLAAQEAAYRVSGVREVENRLEVALTPEIVRTDAELERLVRSALECDVFVPNTQIRAGANEGRITLEGEVSYCSLRDHVERVVCNIQGVRRVFNQVLVRPAVGDAHRIQKAIECALERRHERSARRINLDVHDGKVIVSGVVHSFAERQSVIGAAKGTWGVRSVDDRLSIES
jgi:osmotically-inducible protein OsmY